MSFSRDWFEHFGICNFDWDNYIRDDILYGYEVFLFENNLPKTVNIGDISINEPSPTLTIKYTVDLSKNKVGLPTFETIKKKYNLHLDYSGSKVEREEFFNELGLSEKEMNEIEDSLETEVQVIIDNCLHREYETYY